MQFNNDLAAGVTLVRPALQSPDYVAGSTGWAIFQDGSAEFNDVMIRGATTANGKALYYNGTPAAGNLLMSISAAAGTDEFGNGYPAGLQVSAGAVGNVLLDPTDGRFVSTGSSGDQIAIGDGQLSFNQPSQASSGLIVQNLLRTHGSLYLAGGSSAVADQEALFGIVTSYGAPVAGQTDTYPRTSTVAYSGSTQAYHYVSGAVVKTSDGIGNTAEVWQVPGQTGMPALGTGWAAGPSGGTVQPVQYRRDAEDNLVIVGAVHSTSTTPAATIFTLPAGYRPKITQRDPGVSNSAGTASARYVEVNSSGAVSLGANLTTASTDVYFAVSVPLGNIT